MLSPPVITEGANDAGAYGASFAANSVEILAIVVYA